jgi:hypothetical protein
LVEVVVELLHDLFGQVVAELLHDLFGQVVAEPDGAAAV